MVALNKLYAMDPADKLGYFQIGGRYIFSFDGEVN